MIEVNVNGKTHALDVEPSTSAKFGGIRGWTRKHTTNSES